MEFKETVKRNRAYRRFDAKTRISESTLRELADLARQTASGANLQPLRYHLTWTPEECSAVYPTLKWAGYLKDWDGPDPEERPAAYITLLKKSDAKEVTLKTDAGIAMQTILLGAVEKGLGGCIFASIERDKLREAVGIGEGYEVLFVIALGKPVEEVRIEPVGKDGDIKYYRDENGIHHVPKLELNDIIV